MAFVGLLVTGFAVSGNSPDVKDSGAKVISFYVAHKGEQQAAGFLSMYAVVFFLFFAATFRAYMRRMRPESGPPRGTWSSFRSESIYYRTRRLRAPGRLGSGGSLRRGPETVKGDRALGGYPPGAS